MSILNIEPFSLSISTVHDSDRDQVILEDTVLSIDKKTNYALIGKNGCGKSTLLTFIYNKLKEENKNVHICQQEIDVLPNKKVIEYFYELFPEINEKFLVYSDESLDQEKRDEAEIFLSENGFGKLNSNIMKLCNGLSIDTNQFIENMSGGWRMRLSLATGILLKPDLLILDEPTNHLDLEAVDFLAEYLQDYKKSVLIVSHDASFIDNTCDFIWYFSPDKKLRVFNSDYKSFKQQLSDEYEQNAQKFKDYEKNLQKQKKANKTKEEIEKFIKKNEVKRPEKPYSVRIIFNHVPVIDKLVILAEKVKFGYSESQIIFENLEFGLAMNSRICLVGLNGKGKSTLLKLLANKLQPLEGNMWFDPRIRIGYYSQNLDLPGEITPIEYLQQVSIEKIDDQKARQYLGTIGVAKDCHTKLIKELSGGQKSKTILASLFLIQPHVLLLDEPTNHLDIETIDALASAINNYSGGLMMITHDRRLIETTQCQIINIEKI